MSLVVHNKLEDLKREAWNGLVAGSATGTAFQTYEWHRAWLDTYGTADGLFLVCVYDDSGNLRALSPLRREERRGRRVLRFIGEGRADYTDFIYAPRDVDCIDEMLASLAQGGAADELELNNLPAASPTVGRLEALRSGRVWHVVRGSLVPCPTLLLKGQDSFVERLLAKKSLRRSAKYYEAQGGLELVTTRDPQEILAALPDFFDQHIRRWALRGPQSLFAQQENCEFYRRLTAEMAPTGRLVFSTLRVAGRPIAFHFGFQDGKTLVWYKPSFDPAEADHYPGGVFLWKVISAGRKEGLEELDFTRGDEFYKTRFANHVRYTRNLSLARSRSRAVMLLIREAVRRSPFLMRAARAFLGRREPEREKTL
ncbi:MAG: GNAT family N-acetyltransferase [Candidatus Omnitrophica bacterium]|nr:GNAT family N-acetyltransferase [Candidatus Omnitrophota bacterium]